MRKRILSLILAVSMILPIMGAIPITASADLGLPDEDIRFDESDGYYHVGSANGLAYIAQDTKNAGSMFLTAKIKLDNDIDASEFDAQINIGTKDIPFAGVFDGQGHKITNLTFTAENSPYAGLFAYTKGARIENVVIDNALIKSARQGGILVGWADSTKINNCTVCNSTLEMFTNGAVIELITALGISGGLLVGTAVDSGIYNCEVDNSDTFINQVGGVQALGGDGLYLAGMVGYMQNSIVEYSRVLGGSVDNHFDIAVGALGGKNLYAGGIAAGMSGESKIIDCFATNSVRFNSSVYVSVGAGTTGYAGGIAASATGNSRIERCHYTGYLSSYLYQTLLLFIPAAILTDYYLYGILGKNDSSVAVENCSYDYDRTTGGRDVSIVAVKGRDNSMTVGSRANEAYTTQSLWERYQRLDFVGDTERETGNIAASENKDEGGFDPVKHYNKWVMDYETRMPVHGSGVTVALDFPGAGTVSIAADNYNSGVSTNGMNEDGTVGNNYVVQANRVRNAAVEGKGTVTINAECANDNYQFCGWYKGKFQKYDEDSSYADYEDGKMKIVVNADTEPFSGKPRDEVELNRVEDNDIYIANFKTKVRFMYTNEEEKYDRNSVNDDWYSYEEALRFPAAPQNGTLRFVGWTTAEVTDEQCSQDQVANIRRDPGFAKEGDPVTEPLVFYPVFVGIEGNIHAVFERTGGTIDEYDLNLTGGEFKTTVGQDENGYYVDYNYYINKEPQQADPEGYLFDGWYRMDFDEDRANNPIDISQAQKVSRDKKYYLDDDEIVDDYFYIAKFKYKVTARVAVMDYTLSEGTVSHYYYKDDDTVGIYAEVWVDYNTTAKELCDEDDSIIAKPTGRDREFKWWVDGSLVKDDDKNVRYSNFNNLQNIYTEKEYKYQGPVKAPTKLYAIEVQTGSGAHRTSIIKVDFPGAATVQHSSNMYYGVNLFQHYNMRAMLFYVTKPNYGGHYSLGAKFVCTDQKDQALSWDESNPRSSSWHPIKNDWDYDGADQNVIDFRASADILFHKPNGDLIDSVDKSSYNNNPYNDVPATVTRKYQSLLFGTADSEVVPTSNNDLKNSINPAAHNKPVGLGTTPENSVTDDLKVLNYKFLGWVDTVSTEEGYMTRMQNVDKDSDNMSYNDLPDADGTVLSPEYVGNHKNVKLAEAFTLNDGNDPNAPQADRVYAYMDIYPLYAKYDVDIRTNLDGKKVIKADGTTVTNADGSAVTYDSVLHKPTVTVTDDGLLTITNIDAGGSGKATFKAVHLYKAVDRNTRSEALTEIKLTEVKDESGAVTGYTAEGENKIEITKDYVVIAEYNLNVVYHCKDDKTVTLERKYGAKVGTAKGVTYDEAVTVGDEKYVFVGWVDSADVPENGYIIADNPSTVKEEYGALVTADTLVHKNMDLYPIYLKPMVTTISNLDTETESYTMGTAKVDNDGTVYISTIIDENGADKAEKLGYEFNRWERVVEGGKNVFFSYEKQPSLTKAQMLTENTYIAIYDPVVTYMLPMVNGNEVTFDGESYAEAVAMGSTFSGSSSAVDLIDEKLEDSDYIFDGNYKIYVGGDDYVDAEENWEAINEDNVIKVDKPIIVRPVIIQSVTVTYEWEVMNSEGESTKKRESKKFGMDLSGNVDINGDGKFDIGEPNTITLRALPSTYSVAGKNESGETVIYEYKFTGWEEQNEEKTVYKGGAAYELGHSVKFVAKYQEVTKGTDDIIIWSNFVMNTEKSDTINTKLKFEISEENGVFPQMTSVAALAPKTTEGVTFIGYALVTMGETENKLDGLYKAGDAVSYETIKEYGTGDQTEKRIYAVWAQVKTVAKGSIRLDGKKSGMRVMGQVNTTVLERVGLTDFDTEYSNERKGVYQRGMLFATKKSIVDTSGKISQAAFIAEKLVNKSQPIEAVTKEWYGEDYHRDEFALDADKTKENGWMAYSIIASPAEGYNTMELGFRAYLEFTYEDQSTKRAYGTFDGNNNIRSLQYIAKTYLDKINNTKPEDLSDEAFARLQKFAQE